MKSAACWFGALSLTLACAAPALPASTAESYPTKPIRWIVTFAAGGPTDFVARVIGARLTEAWSQPVIIDVRAGASGVIGTEMAARAPADGYTLLYGTSTTLVLAPATSSKIPYDAFKDFEPITMLVTIPQILIVSNALQVSSVKDLVAYAKANPGKLNYGSGGDGSAPFFGMELFKSMTGINAVHVPYKGLAPALTDLLAGQVHMMFHTAQPSVLALAKNGKLKALAISSARRMPSAPELPTVAESGLPGFEHAAWHGLLAPKNTPKPIVAKLNAQVGKILNDPEMMRTLASQAAVPAPGTPEALTQFMHRETERTRKIMAYAGMKRD